MIACICGGFFEICVLLVIVAGAALVNLAGYLWLGVCVRCKKWRKR